ncbi:unnamed protein product, partial [Rotaria socialis]
MHASHHTNLSPRVAIELLVTAINISLSYLNVSGTFYAYLIASARFRRQTKYVLLKQRFKCFWPISENFGRPYTYMNNQVILNKQ